MTNTERPTTKAEQKKEGKMNLPKTNLEIPKKKLENKPETKSAPETKEEIIEEIKKSGVSEEIAKKEESLDEKEIKPVEIKKPIQKKPKIKKTEVSVKGVGIPVSKKKSMAICKFIKKKKIEKAIFDLEQVLLHKKAIPMRGEIPHRKGIMSGRYADKTTKNFLILLKSLQANANLNELENPVIVEAIANMASRPYGRFGRVKRKRTHIKIIAKQKTKSVSSSTKINKNKEKKGEKK